MSSPQCPKTIASRRATSPRLRSRLSRPNPRDGALPVGEDQLPLLTNLFDQLALALERARLEAEALQFAAVRERDRLRSALLASIGQDVKPRLTAIGAAVRGLRRAGSSDKQ